ncbi:hypothetical protein [Planktothricoides raciborskii]|uniref:Thylakoid-associated protein n=1 Tax=Planktothricoides raciborskii GIHE-MW2 TaxID=2792601 RepID=A0AAU8JEN5_9CYAN
MTNATVEDWSKELLKLQRTMFDKWIEVTPMAAGMKALNVKGSVEESIKFGEDIIAASLELQSQANQSTLDIQKLFWDNYFKNLRQATQYLEKQVEGKAA